MATILRWQAEGAMFRIKGHDVPFSPSTQHAKNSGIVINCTECQKPRVLHSEKKLSQVQNAEVLRFLDGLSYTCGAVFQDIDGYDESVMKKYQVYVRKNIRCEDDISCHYFGMGKTHLCVYIVE